VSEPTSHRVLVVDDEPDITALVAYHLVEARSTLGKGTAIRMFIPQAQVGG